VIGGHVQLAVADPDIHFGDGIVLSIVGCITFDVNCNAIPQIFNHYGLKESLVIIVFFYEGAF